MKISALYDGPFAGQDVYVVGLGPSMEIFPIQALEGKLCILLNDAHKHFPELGPIAFLNHISFWSKNPKIHWKICRGRFSHMENPERDDNMCPWHSPEFYVFSYRDTRWDEWSLHDPKTLWREPCHYWSGRGGTVVDFVIQFCALAKVRSITLVGVDCAELSDLHYGVAAVTTDRTHRVRNRPQGLAKDYDAYRNSILFLKERVTVPIVSLTPFIGIGDESDQIRGWKSPPG